MQAIPHGVLGQSYLTETACLNWMNTRYIYKIRENYSPGCWNLTLHIVWSHTCWVNMNFSKFISLLFPNWKTWLRSVFCACVYFLRIYSPSFCSFVSTHVLFRPSMFFFRVVSLPGKVFSGHVFAGRWSFQILCFYLGRYNDMFLSCNKLHPVWFLTCPTTVTFLASKPYKALLVPKVWRVTPNCYQ